ncbi:MAG TPA: ribosome biogenesis GTP-binding protein YihA/YsxC [Acidobacteriota bacterium]|nr:ribosome biogenesis GTP-binding protein YihA/YsxC [Acidobacteriota bacterium]
MEASFVTSATRSQEYPDSPLPRIAFVGRSNVGKSSLINSLVGRKKLARTSSSPGRTRLINFFQVDSKWLFTDLPGYGYAKVSRAERQRWGPMIEQYLRSDEQLKLLILLVDARHEPSPLDKVMKEWLDEWDVPYVVVATKADKLSANKLQQSLKRIRETFNAQLVLPYSAHTGRGKKELWRIIQEV